MILEAAAALHRQEPGPALARLIDLWTGLLSAQEHVE